MDDDYEDDAPEQTDEEGESLGEAKGPGARTYAEGAVNYANPSAAKGAASYPYTSPGQADLDGPTAHPGQTAYYPPGGGPAQWVPYAGHTKTSASPESRVQRKDEGADGAASAPAPQAPATAASPTSATPPVQAVEPAPDGGHDMTVINGQNQQRWHFGPDGTTTLVDSKGPQADAARQQAQINQLVAPHQLAALQDQAEHAFPVPTRGQFVGGPHGDAAFARARNATLAHQSSFVNTQARLLGQQQITQGTQQSIADRTKAHEMFLTQQKADQQAHRDSQVHQQTMEGGYLKQVMQIQEQLRKSYGEGTLQGSGKEIKDKDGNVTGRWPTAEEWGKTLQDTLDGWGIPRNVHEFRKQHGFAPLQAPAGASATATAQYTPEQQAVLDAIAHPQFKR